MKSTFELEVKAQIELLSRLLESVCSVLPDDLAHQLTDRLAESVSGMSTPSELSDAAQARLLAPVLFALRRPRSCVDTRHASADGNT